MKKIIPFTIAMGVFLGALTTSLFNSNVTIFIGYVILGLSLLLTRTKKDEKNT